MPRLTVTAIAIRLGIHKSTVSRQVRKAGLVGADGLVELAEYESFRAVMLDPSMQTAGPDAERGFQGEGGLSDARARKLAADAERAELELAVRKGELISRIAVATAVESLFRRIRVGVMLVPDQVAPELILLGEEGALARDLSLALEQAIDGVQRDMMALAAGAGGGPAASAGAEPGK